MMGKNRHFCNAFNYLLMAENLFNKDLTIKNAFGIRNYQ